MNVICSNCGKDSGIECSQSKGTDAARVQNIGWSPKCNALFTKGSSWFYYCSDECKKIHYRKVIDECSSPKKQEEVKLLLSEVRKDLKANMPKILEGLQRAADLFKKIN